MRGTDKFLVAIVAGALLLVGVVLVLALLRLNQPSYQPHDTPESVAHNYLLALELGDWARAQRSLSPTLPGYPDDAGRFERDVRNNRWRFGDGDVSLSVESVDVSGDWAEVRVRRTKFYRGGLFESGQHSTTFTMTLRREEGAWKVTDADRYWARCWQSAEGCE